MRHPPDKSQPGMGDGSLQGFALWMEQHLTQFGWNVMLDAGGVCASRTSPQWGGPSPSAPKLAGGGEDGGTAVPRFRVTQASGNGCPDQCLTLILLWGANCGILVTFLKWKAVNPCSGIS